MKKNLLLHSILTLCVMLFTAMGFAQININGGFESWTGSSPDGWLGAKSNIGANNVVQVTSGAHTGDYACQLINTASGHKRFTTQSIHVDNGMQYVISFWVKGGGDIRVAMYDGRETGSGFSPYSDYHSINSTSYQQYTDTVVAANTTDAGEFILSVRSTNEGANHLIVDDVTIIAVSNEGYVAEPTVTLSGNMQSADTYLGPVTVTLSAADGVSIHYTLDGTEPDANSILYTVPFTITESTTLKAVAISGDNSSNVVTRDITILNIVPLFFENFETDGLNEMTVTNVSGTYEWTTATYSGNTYAYANAHNQGATETWLMTPAITPLDAGGVTLSFTTAKNYNGPALQVKYSTDYSGSGSPAAATWTDITSNCAFSGGSWNWTESGDVTIAGTLPIYFAWVYTSEESSAAAWELDNIMVSGTPGQTPSTVTTPVINPNGGSCYEPQTVSITCTDADAIIRYTLDGSEPTENATVYSQPFTVNTTTTIMAKAWKEGMTPSLVATATFTFPEQVANIAAFKAAASNEPQQIMSDVTFVFRSGRYMFVEDNTAAMLIFDNSNPVITNTYNEGDVIQAGVFGKYTTYQGMVEMVPTHNALEATGTPVTVTPTNATISNIKSQYTDVYESKLVHLSNVEFINATTFVQNGDTMAIYNRFNTVTMEISAGDMADVTGFVSYSTNYGYQIYPRGDEDIDIHPVVIMDTVATPEFELFKDGEFYRVNITCATEGASIYYTLDGTDPDESSNLFTDLFPLTLNVHYTLKAIAMKEGMVNSDIAVYDYNPSGINNYELRNNFSVYPNPAINNVTISVKNDNVSIEKVELYNIYGQLLNTMKVNGNMAEISVNALATGTYYAKVFTDKGVVTMPMIRK